MYEENVEGIKVFSTGLTEKCPHVQFKRVDNTHCLEYCDLNCNCEGLWRKYKCYFYIWRQDNEKL